MRCGFQAAENDFFFSLRRHYPDQVPGYDLSL